MNKNRKKSIGSSCQGAFVMTTKLRERRKEVCIIINLTILERFSPLTKQILDRHRFKSAKRTKPKTTHSTEGRQSVLINSFMIYPPPAFPIMLQATSSFTALLTCFRYLLMDNE
ncbi:unnamed protein product [Onchocerca flexuosa]|uniref:Ovule protein n=1 Tax=Onchocerca flexuosa TaxID=387005 RepID=A0A183I2D4_9BILA|nr:unnamed protein product [Onchocerca flexuosa]